MSTHRRCTYRRIKRSGSKEPDLLCYDDLIGAQIGRTVTLGIGTENVVVTGQDGVQCHTGDGGDGHSGQSDRSAAHIEGDAAGEAQTAHQNDCGDDQVAAIYESLTGKN